jgi:predicted nucleic acid-binding protein
LIVIDSCIAVKWVVEEPLCELARSILRSFYTLIAPDLLLPEFANAMRNKLVQGQANINQVSDGLNLVLNSISSFIPSSQLIDDAILLANQINHPVYDCMFLACALSRGKLLTADDIFAKKCRKNGFGSYILTLHDMADGRYEALIAKASVGKNILADIERLTPLIKDMSDNAKKEQSILRVYNLSSIKQDTLQLPYLSLLKRIEQLDQYQLSILLALGWLGRDYYTGQDWSRLLENAKSGSLARDFKNNKSYIMAQLNHVPTGLSKLQAFFNIAD